MYIREVFDYELDNIVNLSEMLVIKVIKQYLEEHPKVCRCGVCLEDMYALALNRIPAKYVQDDFSEHFYDRMLDYDQAEMKIIKAI